MKFKTLSDPAMVIEEMRTLSARSVVETSFKGKKFF